MTEEELNYLKHEISALSLPAIIERPIYEKIYTQEDKFVITQLEMSLGSRARELKVLQNVKNLGSDFQKELKQQQAREKTNLSTLDNITKYSPDINGKSYDPMYCGSWSASDAGVFTSDPSQISQTACYHPILPVRILTNIQTGEERITIAFKKNRVWRELTVPKTLIASNR